MYILVHPEDFMYLNRERRLKSFQVFTVVKDNRSKKV